jgi:16S rRNA processing protein RimM
LTSTPEPPEAPNRPTEQAPTAPAPPARPTRPWRARAAEAAQPSGPAPATPPSEVFFSIGRIVGAHGIRGEVKLEIHSDHPERLKQLRRVYFDDDPTPRRLRAVRLHGSQALLTFPDITDRDTAQALRGTLVRISGSQARPLEDGEFFHYQLIGLSVYDEAGQLLGKLEEILEAGEVDIYIVRDADKREHLFPALKEVVLEIDPAADRMVVRPQVWDE